MTRQNRNKTIAVAVTVAVHAIVVVLLFILALTTPLPLPGEAGVEVNLGMYNQGMGVQQQPKPTKVVEAPKPQHITKTETVTQDTEEAPALEPEKPKKEEPKVNERALFKPAKTEEQPSSEGTTETPGDQGNPNGAKDISNYEGLGGAGGGPSYDLGGRNAKSLPRPSSDFNEEGTIVVDIWVDRDGRVQNAQIGKGTNISNTRMRETAKQAALQSVFAPDKNAAELQKGTITYKFIIRQ